MMANMEPSVRCCCCNVHPHTYLVTWALLKIAVDLFIVALIMYFLMFLGLFHPLALNAGTCTTFIILGLVFVDVLFMMILATAVFKESMCTLKLVYVYSFCLIIIGGLLFMGFTILTLVQVAKIAVDFFAMMVIACVIVNLALNILITFILKTEIARMGAIRRVGFSNMSPINKKKTPLDAEPFENHEDN